MSKIDPLLLLIFSDLFVNLSAGWLSSVIIIPLTIKKPKRINIILLTSNLFLAIVSLVIAYLLKKYGQ